MRYPINDSTIKSAAIREYEEKVQEAFQRYDAIARTATDLEQADARRQFVNEVHSLRAQYAKAYPGESFGGVIADSSEPEPPSPFVVVGLVYIDVHGD